MGPPRTYDQIPDYHVEAFAEWLETREGNPGLYDLLTVIEQKSWQDPQIICPRVYYKLDADRLAAVRAKAIERLMDRPDGFEIGGEVWKTDGTKLFKTLPMWSMKT